MPELHMRMPLMHARLIIDGQDIINAQLQPGQPQPPEFLAKLINPHAKHEPHMMAAGLALTNAIMTNQDITITVDTRPTGWRMLVHTPKAIPCQPDS
jgi:hypothetical protein